MALGMPRRRASIQGDGGIDNLPELFAWIDDQTNQTIIQTALRIHEKLRSNPPVGTPVDTGWASNNWTMTVDKADEYMPGVPKGDFSFIPTFDPAGIAAVMQFDIKKNRAIFIQNNVPYIKRLNEGWSSQSPAGFVESAVDSGVAEVAAERG